MDRALAALLPGLRQVREGRLAAGAPALVVWLSLAAVAAWRWERVVAAPSGTLDERVALATLLLGMAAAWAWSAMEGARGSAGRSLRRWGPSLEAFTANRLAVAALVAVAALCLTALLAPFLAPADPVLQGSLVGERLLAPSRAHPLGTDQLARDVLSRVLYGARISLSIGLLAVAISITIGTVVGACSGFLGGRIDPVIMRLVDVVIAFPTLVLLILVVAFFESSIPLIVLVLGLTQWPQTARLVRGEVLSLREREFVEAARALGFSRRRILFRHVLPNALAPVIVAATLGIGNVIVLEAGLSFLGIGVQPPTPSWGSMVADGRQSLVLGAWWLSTFPGLAIVLTVVAFNVVGDGLRDALDPRLRP